MTDIFSSHVIIGLSNPKSPGNVDSVLRAAGCYGVDAVRYSGTRYARASQCNADTKKIANQIPLLAVESLIADLPVGTKIVSVEFAVGATPLPQFVHPQRAIYVFGPEDGSLSQEIVNQSDDVVYVPTNGCMNLAATVNVLLYDRLAKGFQPADNNEFVLDNRDINNRLSFRKV